MYIISNVVITQTFHISQYLTTYVYLQNQIEIFETSCDKKLLGNLMLSFKHCSL